MGSQVSTGSKDGTSPIIRACSLTNSAKGLPSRSFCRISISSAYFRASLKRPCALRRFVRRGSGEKRDTRRTPLPRDEGWARHGLSDFRSVRQGREVVRIFRDGHSRKTVFFDTKADPEGQEVFMKAGQKIPVSTIRYRRREENFAADLRHQLRFRGDVRRILTFFHGISGYALS